jgi:hypothetical protein
MWCLHMLGLTAIVAAVAVDMTAEVSPSALTVADPPSQVLGSVDAGGGMYIPSNHDSGNIGNNNKPSIRVLTPQS